MRVVLVVVALLAALGAAPPVASAQTGVIDACVQQPQGLTRIVGATETCRQNEIRVQWNVVGPKGDQGPQGPPGVSASASALGGTWTGRIFSIGRSFELPYVYTGQPGVGQNGNINVPLQPPATRQPFWNIPAAPTGVTCGQLQSPCAISWSNQNMSPGTQPPSGFSVTRFNLVTEAVDPNHLTDPSFNTRLAETSSLLPAADRHRVDDHGLYPRRTWSRDRVDQRNRRVQRVLPVADPGHAQRRQSRLPAGEDASLRLHPHGSPRRPTTEHHGVWRHSGSAVGLRAPSRLHLRRFPPVVTP